MNATRPALFLSLSLSLSRSLFLGTVTSLCALAVPGVSQTRPQPPSAGTVYVGLPLDGQDIRVEIEGEKVHATADGKPLDSSRMITKGRLITLHDRDGHPAAYIQRWDGGAQIRRSPRSDKAAIGIEIGPLSKGLADHLGLDPSEVIYVRRAVAGRAAAKAGLRDHDIIVQMDGRKPVSDRVLHEILAEKQPGDEMRVRVLRRGKEDQHVIRCDRAHTSFPGLFAWSSAHPYYVRPMIFPNLPPGQEPGQKTGQKTGQKPGQKTGRKPGQNTGQKPGQKTGQKTTPGVNTWRLRGFPGEFLRFDTLKGPLHLIDPRSDAQVFRNDITTGTRSPQGGEVEKKLGRLEERLKRLERMLEKLVNKKKI